MSLQAGETRKNGVRKRKRTRKRQRKESDTHRAHTAAARQLASLLLPALASSAPVASARWCGARLQGLLAQSAAAAASTPTGGGGGYFGGGGMPILPGDGGGGLLGVTVAGDPTTESAVSRQHEVRAE